MRRLPPPELDPAEVYHACVGDAPVGQLAGTYAAAAAAMVASADQYQLQAASGSLHTLPASNWGHDEQVVIANLTKGDLTKLYESGMLKGQHGRAYYDQILASVPLGKCPYCRFGHAETLDHFLSKARYPSYSVLPNNLIPACMRCNKGKGSGVLTAANEMSHPYFEMPEIEQDIWLLAEITETNPVTAKYSLVIPNHWPADLGHRVRNYFSEFDLAARFAVEAASELVSMSACLRHIFSLNARREHLQRVAQGESDISKNSWKTSLYVALAASDWYSEVGYGLVGVA